MASRDLPPHRLNLTLTLALLLTISGCLKQGAAPGPAVVPGILGQVTMGEPAEHISGGNPKAVAYTWQCGDRKYPLAGRELRAGDPALTFSFQLPRAGTKLTLELREFRRTADGRVAYLVEANGQRLQFRNRRFEGASSSSAFIDIPDNLAATGTLNLRLTNLCDNPICFAAAVLYADLEGYAHREGLVQPLYIGPIIDPHLDNSTKLQQFRKLLPDTPEVKPLFSFADLAIAHWSPETVAQKLDRILAVARELDVKVEIQATNWWASTPRGCDGRGGRWTDPIYQQVTYVPSTGEFGLSVPNCWSNTPWLTVGNQHLNAFKADGFARFGQMLRERYEHAPADFPVFSLVVENEPTYWVEGNPGVAMGQLADFNPAMVAAARQRGIRLDPQDGLSREEKEFLQQSIRDYNREMTAGLRRGLGECALAERMFTGTFIRMQGDIFADLLEATSVGVLADVRLGGAEWEPKLENLALLEQLRELGVPAATNAYYGHNPPVAFDVQFAYATGCDHFTCFDASEPTLAEIATSVKSGWTELKPVPWRKILFTTDRFRCGAPALQEYFVETRGVVAEAWPQGTFDIHGETSGQSGFALMHFTSQELAGQSGFPELTLTFDFRAFAWNAAKNLLLDNPDSYLAVRAGTSRDQLHEIARRFNDGVPTSNRIDLTRLAKGAPELWVEFEFHPVGLADWVSLFDVALEQPWPDEDVLFSNRSYRADRLRCESSIVGWRADVAWSLVRAEEDAGKWPVGDLDRAGLADARRLYSVGSYRQAYHAVRAIIARRAPPPGTKPWAPPPDRQERGEFGGADSAYLWFDPYDAGYRSAVVKLAPDVAISLEENGVLRQPASLKDLLPGDDVTLAVQDNRAGAVQARRGSASGKVTICTVMTPFAMPTLAVAEQPARTFSFDAKIAMGDAFAGWKVGCRPATEGDAVSLRWNPATDRIMAIEKR